MKRLAALKLMLGLCACLLFSTGTAAQQMQLEVIELYSRTADEMIPLLKPMLAPGGTISGSRDKLVIRTTPENFSDLRRILDTVDAPPRRLLISVRQGRSRRAADRNLDLSGSVGSDGVRATVPEKESARGAAGSVIRRDGRDRIRIRADSTRSEILQSATQTVRVNEGRAAFIRVGESVPIRADSNNDAVEYHDVVVGFYAVPRVRGDEVTVQLATSADTVIDRRTGAAEIQRISSVVTGRLGEWLEVGGITLDAASDASGIIYYRKDGSRDQRPIFILVEELR